MTTGRDIVALTDELCRHPTGVVAPGNDALFDRIERELPIRRRAFASGESHNGWRVPESWWVEEATLWRDGRLVHDAAAHPLGVAMQSRSFEGELSGGELRRHIVSDPARPDARIFHCRWQYRPWEADWALCLPHGEAARLDDGPHRVRLRVASEPGAMTVAELHLAGRSSETIVFNSHTCHPGQANDGMVGVATLIRLFQWLGSRERRLSYRMVLGPEHLGTVFYLRDLPAHEVERLCGGLFVEMTGVASPLVATRTFLGDRPLDAAIRHVLEHRAPDAEVVGWRCGAGNDETVWEAPGYEVPFVELTRRVDTFDPYPEYHSSLDTAETLDPAAVEETFEVLRDLVEVLEQDVVGRRRFDGLVCLSSPELDLYPERPDPSLEGGAEAIDQRWGVLVDRILRRFDGTTTVREMADEAGLPFAAVRRYVQRFAEAGLVDLAPAGLERPPVVRAAPSSVA